MWRVAGQMQKGTPADATAWRASLESVQTRERWYFGSLEDVLSFLLTKACPSAREAEESATDV
jgi:hypothetical protein